MTKQTIFADWTRPSRVWSHCTRPDRPLSRQMASRDRSVNCPPPQPVYYNPIPQSYLANQSPITICVLLQIRIFSLKINTGISCSELKHELRRRCSAKMGAGGCTFGGGVPCCHFGPKILSNFLFCIVPLFLVC